MYGFYFAEGNKTVERWVRTFPIRAYRNARKILDSLAWGQKGEKINKADF